MKNIKNIKNIKIPIEDKKVKQYINLFNLKGGKSYIVGGYVRDYLLGRVSQDIDIEVYYITFKDMQNIMLDEGIVQSNFGVISLKDTQAEFSIPRIENKIGIGHKDFEINLKPNMSLKEGAFRRDFTINSIMYDIQNQEIVDNYNGIKHLNEKIICHVSEKFLEDALRVLRAIRFSFVLGFIIDAKTVDICLSMLDDLHAVSAARKNQEMSKFFNVSSSNFKIGIKYFEIILLPYFDIKYLTEVPYLKSNNFKGSIWKFKVNCMMLLNLEQNKYEKVEYKILMLSVLLSDIYNNFSDNILDVITVEKILNDILISKKEKKMILNLAIDVSQIENLLELDAKSILMLFNKYKQNISLLIELMIIINVVSSSYINVSMKDMKKKYNDRKIKYKYLNNLYEEVKKLKKEYNGEYFIKKGYKAIDIKHEQEKKILEYLQLKLQ